MTNTIYQTYIKEFLKGCSTGNPGECYSCNMAFINAVREVTQEQHDRAVFVAKLSGCKE